MQKSEQINELASALAKAQGQMTGAKKDSSNPFFKSRYADLASVWEAIRKPLSDNGLSVIQTTCVLQDSPESPSIFALETTLAHASGQWISSAMPIKTKDESPQAMGSAITYARRYALAAIAGVFQEDDDASLAQGQTKTHDPAPARTQAKPVPNYAPGASR